MVQSTRLAKAVYKLGGLIHGIQRPTRLYKWDVETETFTKTNYRWLGLGTGLTLSLSWAQKLDREHYDHWAYQHTEECGDPCDTCGGRFCPWEDEDDDA